MSVDVTGDRFFTQYSRNRKEEAISEINIVASDDNDALKKKNPKDTKCLCLYYCKKCMPCRAKPNIWETSQNDIFELNDVEDTGYPLILRLLENKAFDVLFISTSLLSVYLYFFSEGFLMESTIMWAIIHLVNIFYTLGVIVHWLKIFIRSKRAKTNQGYTKWDVIFTFCTILPTDIIAMILYSMKSATDNSESSDLMVTFCRIHYIFRIRNVLQYFTSWEDKLLVGDFQMFFIRTIMWITLLIHFYACIYHRVACDSLSPKHFKMTVLEATGDICQQRSWMNTILKDKDSPLLLLDVNVLLLHYLVSLYRAIDVALLLGYGDVKINLQSDWELTFSALTEITAWIFTLVFVSGTLTSLFIEKDTEREEFMTRQFAISRYLDFNPVGKKIKQEVIQFYDYLWDRSRGVVQLDLIEILPISIRAEVFYNINKFVLDKLPLLSGLDDSFVMNLSMHMDHTVHLPGEILFRKDEIGTQMYYIIKGQLDVLNDDETQVLTNIRSGSVLGEIFLIHSYLHVATVRCATECVMMELTKDDFNDVLEDFPDYHDELQKRIEHRFAQSSLLLSLCEKQNHFAANHISASTDKVHMNAEVFGPQQTFDNVANVLNYHKETVAVEKFENEGDLDGLKLKAEAIAKLQAEVARRKSDEEGEENGRPAFGQITSIFKALELDVARATSLAKDLGIALAPMIITAPEDTNDVKGKKSKQRDVANLKPVFTECLSFLRARKDLWYLRLWKCIVSISCYVVLWYYPYQFAYRKPSTVYIDYIFHIFDLVFAIDYLLDMIQIVVTPKRSIENFKEIILFRAKSPAFYIRFISFIPIEYVMAPIFGFTAGVDPYYYAFKMNRLINIPLATKFVSEMELKSGLPMISTFIIKSAVRLVFLIHICAVIYAFLQRDIVPNPRVKRLSPPNVMYYNYSFCLYWATQIVTSTGFGDIPYSDDSEVALMSLSLIFGTCFLINMVAKMASILANSERRRVSFKRTFFQVQSFMNQRKLSNELKARVSKYYKMLWLTNEGVLIGSQDSPIWDAPKHLQAKVSVAQALKYISRIPLTKYLAENVQNQVCRVLRQYCVPPGETVLYPGDRSRELFIINKGFVEVQCKDLSLGSLGVGRYFGVPGLIQGKNKNDVRIVTLTHCELFCLHHDDLMTVLAKNLRFELEYKFLRMGTNQSLKLKEFVGIEEGVVEKPEIKKNAPTVKTSAKGLSHKGLAAAQPTGFNEIEIPVYNFHEMITEANVRTAKITKENLEASRTQDKGTFLSKSISPHGSFLKWWTVIRVLAAVVLTCFAPAQAVFTFNPTLCLYFMLCWDFIAWLDLFVMMRVAFYGPRNQPITDGFQTFKHYLKGSFIIDVFACFPFEYIVFMMYPDIKPFSSQHNYQGKYYLVAYLRLNRVLQVYRMVVAGRVLEKAIFRSLSFLILVEVIPMLIIFIIGAACLAAYLVCNPPVDGKTMVCSDNAWLTHGNLYKYQELKKFINYPAEYFIVGVYWVTNSILAVGYGDLDLLDDFNRKIAILVIILGLITTGFLASKLTACMAGEDPRKLEIREKAQIIFSFLEQYRTSRSCRSRVREHYFSAWDKTKGILVEDLFAALHPTLKTDVMKELYEPFLRKSPVFANLDEPGIRMLSLSLKEVYYPEGEFIMKYGDLNDDVFLICSGVVVGYTAQGKIIGYMGTGSLIGEISVLYDVQRLYTAVTATGVELFVFGRDEFVAFLRVYPEIHLALEKACLIHYRQTILETTAEEAEWEDSKQEDLENFGFSLNNEAIQQSSFQPKTSLVERKNTIPASNEKGSRFVNAEVDLACLEEHVPKEKENDTEEKMVIIEDPIRVIPVKKEDVDNAADNVANQVNANNHWYSWLLTFGKKIPRDEMGFIHIIQDKKKLNPITFVVHPSSNVCCNCVSLYLCLTAISCGLTAYEIAFGVGKETEGSIGGATTITLSIRIILEIFFCLRMIGNFHLGYYNSKGVLMQTIKQTSIKYISQFDGFFIDLISTLPFYMLASTERQASNIRCLQLLRMILFVRYLNESATDLRMKASNVKIFKVTVLLCFVFHFAACSWYLVSCYGDDCNPRSWVSVLTKDVKDAQALVDNDEVKIGNRYLLALNYVANTITYSGLSDMTARLTMELIMTIMIIFATVLIVGQLLGEMTQCLSSQVSSKIHFQYKLSFLESHLNTLGLKAEKINEVVHYFKQLWSTSKSMQYHTIMQELPYPLRADIYFEIYGPPIKKSRILRKLDDEVIRQICVKVRHEMYMAGARIMRVGNVVNTMYIVTKGEVVVLDEDKNTDICVTKLVEGNCFGEVKMFLPDAKYAYSYTARLETEIGVISREDLFEVLQKYPMLKEELQTLAQNIILQRQARVEEEKRRFQNIRGSLVSNSPGPAGPSEEGEKGPGQINRFLKNSPSLQDINLTGDQIQSMSSFGLSSNSVMR